MRKIVNSKSEELSKKIDDVTEAEDDETKTFAELMSDDQIRENLKEANAWRNSFDALTDEMN